jgi:hypothetical protein
MKKNYFAVSLVFLIILFSTGLSLAADVNIAPSATVTASSEYTDPGYVDGPIYQTAPKAVDGFVDGCCASVEAANREWATIGEGIGAWLNLSWSTPYYVNRVVLHDRINLNDQITSATLSFSDGPDQLVGPLNNDGTAIEVILDIPRLITSMRMTVTGVSGTTGSIGLAELEVFETPLPTTTTTVESTTTTTVQDITPPEVAIIIPQSNVAVQDGVIFQTEVTDASSIDNVSFSLREPNGEEGIAIGYDDLQATYNSSSGYWEYWFDTTKLQDGYYVIFVNATDIYGNEGMSSIVPFSIRNWAVITQFPATPNSNAGRTMPVKFSLRIAKSVDPTMPFVYNEDLEIMIYDAKAPGTILQRSVFGSRNTDYRINGEIYITNFQTKKTPATYVVEIWRPTKNFMVGSFTFKTVK